MERMDRWLNRGDTTVIIDLSEPAGPISPGEVLANIERFERVKPGATVEIEARHRRSVQDVFCTTCNRPIANEQCPSRTPTRECHNKSHPRRMVGGQGMYLVRLDDNNIEAPPIEIAPAFSAPPRDEAPRPRIPDDPDEALLMRARAQIAKRNQS